MFRHAVINENNLVENIVIWDGVSSWQPPEGRFCINIEGMVCDIGWTYNNGVFTPPVVPEEVVEPPVENGT